MPRRRRIRWLSLTLHGTLLMAALWLLSLGAVIAWGSRDRAQPSEAIVVLGAAQYAGRPSPVFRARLDHAVSLWHQGMAPRVIVTGGIGTGDTISEAAVARRYVLRRGVPDTAILMEGQGRTTSESLQGVAELMQGRGREVILVSDPFHMLRLTILARRYGLTARTSPTQTSPIADNPETTWKYFLSESLKVPLVLIMERSP
jgi:uncharacterized SAM-binding protein YcdF (DUF218 family)